MCFKCGIPFLSQSSLHWHIKSLHGYSSKLITKTYRCAICKHICSNRRELYTHRMNQHGGNQHGGNDGNPELEDVPPYIMQESNDDLTSTYVTNRNHIHAAHSHGDVKHVYNFPTDNLNAGYREIRRHLEEIYNDQHNAFRINLAFGMILFNNQTREYRYYIPYFNSWILQYPFTILSRNSITFLMNKLTRIDIIEQAKTVRPSTAWSLAVITNIQYIVYTTDYPLGQAEDLPMHLKVNKYLRNMYINPRTKLPYEDNMCFFRCLRVHCNNEKTVNELFNTWRDFNKRPSVPPGYKDFHGVTIDDMTLLEDCFNVKIKVYSINEDANVNVIFDSISSNSNVVYLNVYHNHLSYITNYTKFIKKFQCLKCSKLFKREWNMKRHNKNCFERTKLIFPGGFHNTNQTIFDKLHSLNINIPERDRYYPYYAVWDMEAVLSKNDSEPNKNSKLKWISQHIPISVSVASNVSNYRSPKCFVNQNSVELISDMMAYLREISLYNASVLKTKFESVFSQLDQLMEDYQESAEHDSEYEYDESEDEDSEFHRAKLSSHFFKSINKLKDEFNRYINQLPVIGFNSGKYDINLIKHQIMSYISMQYNESDIFTIKRENSYLSIATPHLKFLDISNYLAAGCSYAKFLKAYGSEISKGIFPYEWFDSFEKLSRNCLPDAHEFFSKLSNSNPIQSEEDYTNLQHIWTTNHMQTFKDYLIYHNNLDTGPFCTALDNFIQIYKSQKIDIFKDYVSLPGVARKMLYDLSKSNFALISPDNADLYYTFKRNIVGGPSIIFTRYHEKDVTYIKKSVDKSSLCKALLGYDCNGLYSYAIKQEMPTGVYVRRYADNSFRPEVSEKYIDSYVWMDYLMKEEGIVILHKLNNQKEVRVGSYLVDGLCLSRKTVYEFNGCYFHHCNHDCFIVKKSEIRHGWIKSKRFNKKTKRKDSF